MKNKKMLFGILLLFAITGLPSLSSFLKKPSSAFTSQNGGKSESEKVKSQHIMSTESPFICNTFEISS